MSSTEIIMVFVFFLIAISVYPNPGHAQSTSYTDAPTEVSQLLSTFGPVPLTIHSQQNRSSSMCIPHMSGEGNFSEICHTVNYTVDVPTTSSVILSGSNIRIVALSQPNFGSVNYTSFPSISSVNVFKVVNCQSTPQTSQGTVSVSVQRTTSVQITHSVQNLIGSTVGLQIAIPGGEGGPPIGNISGSVTVSQSTTDGQASTETDSNTITQTQNATETEPANTASFVTISAYKIGVTIPFTISAILDADLSPNDRGYQHLSDIISEPARTFEISGNLSTNGASFATVTYGQTTPTDASDCVNPALGLIKVSP